MDLKSTLKNLKLNESNISMILGVLVVIVSGVLVVNYFKDRNKPNILTTEKNTNSQVSLPSTHTVTKDETLWSISETYFGSGYNWIDIAKTNNLKNPDRIEEGQVLTIPKISNLPSNSSISGANYTVVKGDSLWKIAVRSYGDGYKWNQIAKENNLAHPNLIHPGNVLRLPR